MPVALASSAVKDFDLRKTVEEAKKNGFKSVQLYIDSDKFDDPYIEELINELRDINLEIVIHLRNLPEFNDKDRVQVERILNELPNRKIQILIHYFKGMTVEDVPYINGVKVGIENSKTGVFDPDHVEEAFELSRACNSYFVFDHGRILYAQSEEEAEKVINYIIEMINRLDPKKDIIHSADKRGWTLRFKSSWTYLGDPQGKAYPLIDSLRSFHLKGGTIVFEHEDLEFAVKSKETLVES